MASDKQLPKKKKRRYLRSKITQNLIINKAEEVFLEKGYSKTTITLISKKAGVGYGTVYSHFKGKDDLLSKIIDKAMEGFFTLLKDIPDPDSTEVFHRTLRKKIYDNLKTASENREIMMVFNKALGLSEEVNNHWNKTLEQFINVTMETASVARNNKVIKDDLDLELSIKAFCFTIEKFIWEVVFKPETDIKKLSEVLSRLYLCGLCGQLP